MSTTEAAPAPPLIELPRLLRGSAGASPARATRRRRVGMLLGLAALLALMAGGWALLGRPTPPLGPLRLPEGPVAAPLEPGTVVGLGRLLPRSRIVTVAPPFGAGDARLASLPVTEGERVAAGAVLAVLDSEPALRAALAAAEADLAAREAALVQARVTVASARDDARAALARAEAAILAGQRDLVRAVELAARGAATPQVVDQRRVVVEQATADAARARAALLRYDAPDPESQADVLVARRGVDAARAEVGRARADLERGIVRAPFAGTVLTIYTRLGERPGNFGILTFGGLDDMIAEVEVYETRLRELSPGSAVALTAAALPSLLSGRVERVGSEILRQTLTDASPAANTDSRVGRVVVALDPASAATAARFAGLQVLARFGRAP